MSARRRTNEPRTPPAETRARPPRHPGLLETLRHDVAETLRGGTRRSPRAAFHRTLADLEEFYVSSDRRERLARTGRIWRWALRAWWLFNGLVLKLTPARRLLLAVALLGMSGISFRSPQAGIDVSLDFKGFSIALLLLVLALELKDKLVAHDELEAGRFVQRALMPAQAPVVPNWDIWMFTQSANEVGGDLVDYVQVDASETALVLADVAGKGLSAALLTAKLQATMRALVTECGSLARLGECVNQIMYRDGVRGRFVTLIWLGLRAADGRVRVLNAGHMPPIVVSAAGIVPLPRGSMALAMVPAAAFTEQAVTIAPGETLVAYSDGVTEMMNAEREFFGDQRLRDVLVAQRGREAEVIGRAIVEAVTGFAAGTPPHDDVSLVVARRTM
jgi:sigma-B regulation protein RsbU (phosphoserine phosphatase)